MTYENTLPKWVVKADSLEEAKQKLAVRNRPKKQQTLGGRGRKNWIGHRSGKILVLAEDETCDRRNLRYICRCDCGLYLSISSRDMLRKKHCGCEGWVIQKFAWSNCLECGMRFRFPINDRAGKWCSRKCYRTSNRRKIPIEVTRRWKGMMERCYNPNHHAYHNYGGRGITVCDDWKDISNFYDWIKTQVIPEGFSMDRKDNDGNYEPLNVQWSSKKQQANNTRHNVVITAFGETKRISEWINDPRCKAGYSALLQRRKTGNWTNEKMISTPPSKFNGNINGLLGRRSRNNK